MQLILIYFVMKFLLYSKYFHLVLVILSSDDIYQVLTWHKMFNHRVSRVSLILNWLGFLLGLNTLSTFKAVQSVLLSYWNISFKLVVQSFTMQLVISLYFFLNSVLFVFLFSEREVIDIVLKLRIQNSF